MSSTIKIFKVKKGKKTITDRECWGFVHRPYNMLERIAEDYPTFYDDGGLIKVTEEMMSDFFCAIHTFDDVDEEILSYDEICERDGVLSIEKKYNRYSPYTFWDRFDIYLYRC